MLYSLTASNQKILWFDVAMQEVSFVHLLNSLEHLTAYPADGFLAEFLFTKLKQVIDGGTKHIHYQDIEITFNTIPVYLCISLNSSKFFIKLVFILQLWVICFVPFKFDCYHLFILDIDTLIQRTEGTLSQFPLHFVITPNQYLLGRIIRTHCL